MTEQHLIGPMEVFLMAAISRGGLNTLYAFQQAVGLQPGSLRPVIQYLEDAGLMVRAKGAKRGRRAMALTEAGERLLVKEWRNSLDPHREMESILRSTTVALLMGDVGAACSFLIRSGSERLQLRDLQGLRETSVRSAPISFHAHSRALYESRLKAMEADVLEKLARDMEEERKAPITRESAAPRGS